MGVGKWVVDFLWPPRSLLSDAPTQATGLIDAAAWSQLRLLTPPWCACCGLPFETVEDASAICGACAAEKPAFDAARAAIAYGPASRRLVLDLKRGGRRDGLALFGRWMAQAGADLVGAPGALITPVPLHWTRLIERRFNQAAWLAEALAAETGLALRRDLLVRTRRRRSQGGLSATARRRNVGGAFQLPLARRKLVAGRTVILVDDVFTTGATVSACARALKTGGAARVCVITLARALGANNVDPASF